MSLSDHRRRTTTTLPACPSFSSLLLLALVLLGLGINPLDHTILIHNNISRARVSSVVASNAPALMVMVRDKRLKARNSRGIGFASNINTNAKSGIILGLAAAVLLSYCYYIYDNSHILYSLHVSTTTTEEGPDYRRQGSSPFLRLEGANTSWKVIDWQQPFSADEESKFTCTWTEFQSSLSGVTARMCVHHHDIISYTIMSHKRWGDCNILPVLWNNGGHNVNDEALYYVEIGANIGSCLMEMLLSTNASIIAFEPHPMNLFNMKKTISLLDETYQNRITLFPLGLGNASEASTIYSATGNMGNSGKQNRRSINRYYSIRRSS